MKGRARYVKCFSVGCYRLVLQLNFIVTVELLYDQAESDFVQCQTKMRAFASRICSEFKQIELNWNRIVHQNALWSLVFSKTRPWNKQISAPDAGQPSSQVWNIWRPHIFSLLRISTMMKWFGNVNCVDTKAKNSKNFKFRNTVFLPKNPRY